MRASRYVLVTAMAALIGLPAVARAQAVAMSPAEQAVAKADSDRFAAIVKADKAALTLLLADDLTYAHSNANFQNKTDFITAATSGALQYLSFKVSAPDVKVKILGSNAIVTGVAAVHVIDHGDELAFKIRYISVHKNVGGAWKLTAWQSTKFP